MDQDKGLASKQIHRKRLPVTLEAALGRLLLFADPTLGGRLSSHRWRRRLLLDQHPVQLPQLIVIKKPADHVRRDLACALRVKLVPGRELEQPI
jgi:hypothetical protein